MKRFKDSGKLSTWEHIRILHREAAAYQRLLEKLKPRLSKLAYDQFAFGVCEKGLHDARLLSLQVGDAFGYVADGTKPFSGRSRGYVEIRLLGQAEDLLHTFRYRGLKRFECRMSRRRVWSGVWVDEFGYLDVHELTSVNARFLRHEYEFMWGASIVIEFEKLVYRRERIRRKYPDRTYTVT